jgi:RNA polymerase sigma-70 factor (ECF subfamily)
MVEPFAGSTREIRSFLLTFLKNFLSDQRDRAKAQKRGGDKAFVSLDACESEERDAIEPADGLTADQVYDRRWAQAVMEEAYKKLREDYAAKGKADLFEQLKDLQPGKHGEQSYVQIGTASACPSRQSKCGAHVSSPLRKAVARRDRSDGAESSRS